MTSRMAARCRSNPFFNSFESVSDLYLTLPSPSKALKNSRGKLRQGLLQLFSARARRIIACGDANLFIGWQMKGTKFELMMPQDF